MKALIISFLLFANLNAYCSDNVTIEQKAFDYFINNLKNFNFFCFNFHTFDTLKNKIYFKERTQANARILYGQLQSPWPLDTFISKEGLIFFEVDLIKFIKSDSISTEIKPNNNCFIFPLDNSQNIIYDENNDFHIYLSSKFVFKSYYIVRIDMYCEKKNRTDEFYIKLDLKGNPISYAQISGQI